MATVETFAPSLRPFTYVETGDRAVTAVEGEQVMFVEDFSGGLGLGGRWQHTAAGDFTADDGAVLSTSSGISIAPAARNPDTGEPMFTKDVVGSPGHLKWMVQTTEAFPTGGGAVRVGFRAGARSFGTSSHPYGDDVVDADADIRLGSATLNVLDFESGMVFDFWIGNSVIVPYYERLRLPGSPAEYEAFGSVADPIPRNPDAVHDLSIVVDVAAGTARWEVDGTVVASVARIGPSAPGWTKVLDHGGIPEDAAPQQLLVGMALMTLLDAGMPRGLVDIGSPNLLAPTEFSHDGPTLFGQGVQLNVERIVVERV